MFKIIISNLWRRRRQNMWLFLELIIVTILTWIIADSTFVGIYDTMADQGYDPDRLVYITIDNIPDNSLLYDIESGAASIPDLMERTLRTPVTLLKNMPEVENATHVYSALGSDNFGSVSMGKEWMAADSTYLYSPLIHVYDNSDFFNVYGIEAADSYPSVDELMSRPMGNNDYIITESLNRKFWGDRPGLQDKYFEEVKDHGDYVDTVRYNVVGVVKDFHINSYTRTTMNVLYMVEFNLANLFNTITFAVRLKAGVDADRFASDKLEDISDMLRIGNMYVRAVNSQRTLMSRTEASRGVTSSRNLALFVGALFLINLIVGVVGCVWLQTVKRVKEVGVLRSYGALRRNITGMLIGESVVLATVSVIIGCVIYLQYAVKQGLSNGVFNNSTYLQQSSWVTDFGAHFAIMSAVVYVIIIVCVIIGTYFPARHVSSIEPVDALRDE